MHGVKVPHRVFYCPQCDNDKICKQCEISPKMNCFEGEVVKACKICLNKITQIKYYSTKNNKLKWISENDFGYMLLILKEKLFCIILYQKTELLQLYNYIHKYSHRCKYISSINKVTRICKYSYNCTLNPSINTNINIIMYKYSYNCKYVSV